LLNARKLAYEPIDSLLEREVADLFAGQVQKHLKNYADDWLKQGTGAALGDTAAIISAVKDALLKDPEFQRALAAEMVKSKK
jgi:hypothetical protein